MASTSSSSSSTSSQPNHSIRFDVFLSFRGEDTRHTFTDHLFHALKQAGLRTFRDDDEIGRGEELKPEIESAIFSSRASIVVLSENYADSKWCLDELWLILEQRRKKNHFVLPVFYHVDPSDVRNQRRSFVIKAEERVEGSKWTEENVNRWKAALTEVANLTGEIVSGSETVFIGKVVDTVYCKLDLKLLSTPIHQTGIKTRAQVIDSWLNDDQSDTNVLAICGMGGGGKTTLAQYVYNCNKQKFNSSSFVEEIGKHSKQSSSLSGLQTQLLGDVLGRKNATISSTSEGTRKIEEVLEMKKVFIVLDDIDEHEQLDALLGGKTLHTQSKIVITTRILDIDAWFGSVSWRCRVHKLELLNDLESLELFSRHAFGSNFPMAGFEKLAAQLAQYCAGNPLALKVLGSSLFIGAENPSNRNTLLELWESRLKLLSSMKGDVDSKILGVLQRSFDSLPYNNAKELFLHIACFFVDDFEEDVVWIFEDDLHAKSGMKTLINRCLLTLSLTGELKMHQLLQDMGRRMVCDESKDPAECSRVWCSDEAYKLLSSGNGSQKIKGLSLDIHEIEKGTKQPLAALEAGSLVKMKNLKLLKLMHVQLVGPYEYFPDLRWLYWHGFHLKTIPSGLLTSRLVALRMHFAKLEKFEPPTVLGSLKKLDLWLCQKLVSICGFNLLPKLEELHLAGCSSLTHVCKTIGELKSLRTLSLNGCYKMRKSLSNKKWVNQLQRLEDLPVYGGSQEQELFFLPQSLESLSLGNCDLQFNNELGVVFHSQSFFSMNLSSNLFNYLPDNFNLKVFRELDLTSCLNLKFLPCLPNTLQVLYVDWCTSLERITFQSARFSLQKFGYEGCFSLSEIEGLFKLVSLANINEADLGDMQWIKAYQHHKVDLVGDVITKGRSWHIQMLYEYGIRSTYLQGIKDQRMTTHEYTSSSDFLSFRVPPMLPNKRRIEGLNVSCLYRTTGKDKDMWLLFLIISNKTKGLTWAYNPVVYCIPKVDEDVVWLSYWPIGNILDDGDEVEVEIYWDDRSTVVSWCGASLVYMKDGEVGEEEKRENCTREEEVIGGDLSEFEVTTGGYYLCRRNYVRTHEYLKWLFGDNIEYTNSQGWRKARRSFVVAYMNDDLNRKKIEVGVSLIISRSEMDKIEKALSSIARVESVSIHQEIGRLYVIGCVDLEEVTTCVRGFEMVNIIHWNYHY